ncbi:uncharacterized protein EDB93DRAFT_1108194 [Suillus bovinus]|uniref:uncharacterized protein n=1 Tax=Suillus bovinus TaxID=48563 RepID=UPI001B87D82B|nr:uncharacterized protein EDB93DRAFT_1108194 [Suillus bovinus]KAG2130967.1 hypothetical protein EDB93DRAFT_1108194 [Suillus bovinus]
MVKEHQCQHMKHSQGRKHTLEKQDAVYHNWHRPFTWVQIDNTAKNPSVTWSSTRIVQYLKKKDLATFKGLAKSTVEGWIDHSGKPKWTEAAIRMTNLGNHQGHSNGAAEQAIIKQLQALHDARAVLTLITIREIIIAILSDTAPDILEHQAKDGSKFQCSDAFV